MSKKVVEAVIGKALLDECFRLALLADADIALAGFKLTKAEKMGIKRLDGETLDTLARLLDEQKKKLRLNYVW
jgi:O-phosphoseryl-tRNA(Cys) synthetase